MRTGGYAVLVGAYAGLPRRARAVTSAPTTFDYYISTTGSNSNPGTLASPWAITALNSPSLRALYAGKSVGLIAGVYNIYSLVQAAGATGPALCVQGGTAASPTYIASCNSSGAYAPRVAQISGDSSGGLNGGNYPTSSAGLIGQGMTGATSTQTVWGNVVLDGLYITRSYQFGITFWGLNNGTPPTYTGNVVQNCEIYDIAGWENGNMAGVNFFSQNGARATNNLIHSVLPTSGNIAWWDCLGLGGQQNWNNVYEYNTIYNCNTCIYDKNTNTGGQTWRYNYLESLGTNPNAAIQDGAGGNAGQVTTVHHNIVVCTLGQNQGLWYGTDALRQPNNASTVAYNNTFYMLASGCVGEVFISAAGNSVSPASAVTFYNNITMYAGGSIGYAGLVSLGPPGYVTSDYNCFYQSGATSSTALLGMGNGSADSPALYSLTNWQGKFGLDAKSLVANPAFTSPGGAVNPAGYQLGASSPCLSAGRVGGTNNGAVCNMGAWDGTATQIGCSFASGASLIPLPPVIISVT